VYCLAVLIRRAVKVSLKWVAVKDRRRIAALSQAYTAAVRFFVQLLWAEPGATFSTTTSKRLVRTRLSARYRDQALKQAVEIVASTKKSGRALGVAPGRPFFRGMAVLDAKFVSVEQKEDDEHDLVIRLACLKKGKPLALRSRRTGVLKKWLARPGARLVAGCGLGAGDLLTLWVEFPAPTKRTEGPVLGVDVGVTKLLATSNGQFLGTEFRAVGDKVRRRKPGSKGRQRARRERDDLICASTRRLPWGEFRAVAFEDLAGIKFGKKRGRGRSFRRAMAPWRPPLVEARLTCLAAENGVLAIPVPAPGNSTTCPRCQHRSRKNRNGSAFRCVECAYEDDADLVGALAAKKHGEALLGERMAAWNKACADDTAKRERRQAAAKKRGDMTAEKWRKKRDEALRVEEVQAGVTSATVNTTESFSKGAQLPAARTPRGSAPIRNQASGSAPDEIPEAGDPRGRRRKAAGRCGAEPTARAPSRPQGELPSSSRVLALDGFSDKP
jgi:hypothetical protein